MSIDKCLLGKVKARKLTKAQAEELTQEMRRMRDSIADDMSPVDAEIKAAQNLRQLRDFEAERAKALTIKSALAQNNVRKIMMERGGDAESFLAQLDISLDGKNNDVLNVSSRENEVKGVAFSFLDEVALNFRSRVPGTFSGNHKMHNDLARAVHGETPKDYPQIAEYVRAWQEVSEYLRQRFNNAGGDIQQRADWGIPHKHSPELFQQHFRDVRKRAPKGATLEEVQDLAATEWIEDILPGLDTEKMLDLETGEVMSEAARTAMLKTMYKRVYTDGLFDLEPGKQTGAKMLANQRMERRVLPFKDADSWHKYSKKYSNLNPYQSMIEHIQGMSQDIAMMEVLGPNPNATVKMAKDVVAQNRALDAKNSGVQTASIDRLYDTMTGKANVPIRPHVAAYFDDLANVLTTAQLGGAAIPAFFGDGGTSKVARRLHGLPHWNFVRNVSQEFFNSKATTMAQAARVGLAPELFFQDSLVTSRFVGDMKGHEWSRRLPNALFRLTGLAQITQGRSNAFSVDLLGHLHDSRALSFDELNPMVKEMMDNFGIDEAAWKIIRNAPTGKVRNAELLDMAGLIRSATTAEEKDAASRLFQFVKRGERLAVPTSTDRVRAIKSVAGKKGSFFRTVGDSTLMYKTFPMTYMHTHILNLGSAQKTKLGSAAIYGELFLLMTLGGALALQSQQFLSGKTPLPMVDENGIPDPKFVGAAVLKGGSFGFFGDFLFADQNKYGQELQDQLGGPMVSAVSDFSKFTIGNATQLIKGEDTKAVAEGRRLLERNVLPKPFYAKLATERLIMDRLEEYLDEDTDARFNRKERKAERDFGQKYWWAPGDGVEDIKKPDLSTIVKDN